MPMPMSMPKPEMATEAKLRSEAGIGIGICPRCAISNCISSRRGEVATGAMRGGAEGRERDREDASDERADMCRDSKRYSVSVFARHRLRRRRCHSH